MPLMLHSHFCIDIFIDVSHTVETVGVYHSCAMSTSNEIKCWGDNDKGTLGIGSDGSCTTQGIPFLTCSHEIGDDSDEMGDALLSVDLGDSFTVKSGGFDCGDYHCCTLSTSSQIKCWGV